MNKQRVLLFIPLVIFLVMVGFFWRGLSLDPNAMPSALIGQPFPEFQQPALLQPERQLTRADMKGQVTLVNVWASWCVACRYEHPVFNALSAAGIPIIGLNYKDSPDNAKQWLEELGNPYRFTIVDRQGDLGIDLGVFGAPETYLVDAEGIIRYKQVGIVDKALWEHTLKPLYEQYVRQSVSP